MHASDLDKHKLYTAALHIPENYVGRFRKGGRYQFMF